MASPEAIAAAWATWHSRHGGKLGPGPAFAEAIAAAVAVESGALRRAGHIAGLREAEAKAREFREHWSCAGGFGGHSAAARIIADTLSARITALEEEGKK